LVLVSGLAIGFIASFFGIGGGIVFLIVFIAAFGMPAHVVTATSMLSMLFIAPVGVVTHWLEGNIDPRSPYRSRWAASPAANSAR
jgi:uncharacterized membrane protein YfcA